MEAVPDLDELIIARERYHDLVRERAVVLGVKYAEKSMSAQGVHFIMETLAERKAKTVLDLGLGFSTVTVGAWLADQRLAYWGVDHDEDWLKFMRHKVMSTFGERPATHLKMSPKEELKKDDLTGAFDAIIVDHGPQLDTRAADTPWLTKLLRPNGIMLFDDWRPKHEGRIRRALAKTDGEWKIGAAEHTRRFPIDKAIGWATRA